MMTTLLESQPHKQKSAGGTIFSVVFHSALIFRGLRHGAPGVAMKRKDRAEGTSWKMRIRRLRPSDEGRSSAPPNVKKPPK